MRKFKHLNIFAVTAEQTEYENIYKINSTMGPVFCPSDLIEKSSDWEEIKDIVVRSEFILDVNIKKEEPNYLITAFRSKANEEVVNLESDGKYRSFGRAFEINELINCRYTEIYSVKNSKGEEFTIGDTIKYEDNKCIGPVFKIHNFFINRDNILLARSSMESAATCEDINTISSRRITRLYFF